MKKILLSWLLLSAVFASAVSPFYVGDFGGGGGVVITRNGQTLHYAYLTNAISAAQYGDTIILQPGTTNWIMVTNLFFPRGISIVANAPSASGSGGTAYIATTNTVMECSDNDYFRNITFLLDILYQQTSPAPALSRFAFGPDAWSTPVATTNITFDSCVFRCAVDGFYSDHTNAQTSASGFQATYLFRNCQFYTWWDALVLINNTNDLTTFENCYVYNYPGSSFASRGAAVGMGNLNWNGGGIIFPYVTGTSGSTFPIAFDIVGGTLDSNAVLNLFPSTVVISTNTAGQAISLRVSNKSYYRINAGPALNWAQATLPQAGSQAIVQFPNWVGQYAATNFAFISGYQYSNTSPRAVEVNASAVLVGAAVNGFSLLSLEIPNNDTNFAYMSTKTTSLTQTNMVLIHAFIPAGTNFWFTNQSSGAGNTAYVTNGQMVVF